MPVAFDSTTLSILLNPKASVPADPATGKPPDLAKERIQALVEKLQKERQKIIIPAPGHRRNLDGRWPNLRGLSYDHQQVARVRSEAAGRVGGD